MNQCLSHNQTPEIEVRQYACDCRTCGKYCNGCTRKLESADWTLVLEMAVSLHH
jgi:hypothetical protein